MNPVRNLPALVALMLSLWLAGPAGAQFGPAVGLRSHQLRVEIDGLVATTTLDQVWANYTSQEQEAVFEFRLPVEAAVHEMALWVGGRRSPAEVLPRVTAERIYREIRDRRRDPALLTSLGGGLYLLRVFPIPPHKTQKTQIVCSQLLRQAEGALQFESLAGNRRSSVGSAVDLDFSAVIRLPGELDVRCPGRDLGVQKLDDGSLVVGLRAEGGSILEPIRLDIRGLRVMQATGTATAGDGRGVFAAVIPGPAALAKRRPFARNIVFVLDTSESMGEGAFDLARAGLLTALKSLTAEDTFAVVLAGGEPKAWKSELVPGAKENTEAAAAAIKAVKPAGATDLAAGMKLASTLPAGDRPIDIFLLSDGLDRIACKASNSPQVPPAASAPATRPANDLRLPPRCRLFALLTGTIWEELEDLAQRTGGYVLSCDGASSLQACMEGIMGRIRQAPILEASCRVVTVGNTVSDLVCSGYGPDGTLVVAGRFDGTGVIGIELSMEANGRTHRWQTGLMPGERQAASSAGSRLLKIWAGLRGQQLARTLQGDTPKLQDLESLVQFSRRHRVVTPMTAMLVLETDKDYLTRGLPHTLTLLEKDRWLLAESEKFLRPPPVSPENQDRMAEMATQADMCLSDKRYADAADTLEKLAAQFPGQQDAGARAALLREFDALDQVARSRRSAQSPSPDVRWPWYMVLAWDQPMEYPPFNLATGKDLKIQKTEIDDNEADKKVRAKLQEPLDAKDFNDAELQKVVQWLRESTGLSMHVKWGALTLAGIDRAATVNIKLGKSTAQQFLRTLLDDVGGGTAQLSYEIEDGVLTISTREDLSKRTLTRVYDVRDLVLAEGGVSRLRAAGMGPREVARWSRRTAGNLDDDRNGRGTGGALFDTGGPADNTPPAPPEGLVVFLPGAADVAGDPLGATLPGVETELANPYLHIGLRAQIQTPRYVQDLMTLIQDAVDPTSWRKCGGDVGSIRQLGGWLVVTQTRENHGQIIEIIDGMRPQLRFHDEIQAAAWMPEQMFTGRGVLTGWVLDLLDKARKGTLSPVSSVAVRTMNGRKYARIGGIWLDLAMTEKTRVYPVVRRSPAGEVLRSEAKTLSSLLEEDLVVVVLDEQTAVTLGELGIARDDHPDLQMILKLAARMK